MKKIIVTTIVIVIVLLVAIATLRILSGPEDGWICENGQWLKHGNPSGKIPDVPCSIEPSQKQDAPKPIGGDKDEHGCLIAAGYSWCDSKQKCLRVWEEKCETGK